jgi:hypothetical protein
LNWRPYRLLFLLMLFLTGCGPTVIRNAPIAGQGQATRIPTPNNEILFRDDFSNPESGWDTSSDEHGADSYTLGGYRMTVTVPQYDSWVYPGKDFVDVQIEADAIRLGGPDNNDFGLICRLKDNDNYYSFTLGSNGYYAVYKRQDGESALLGMTEEQTSPAILTGIGTNHIRVDCVGSRLTLYANQTKLFDVQDTSFTHGDVGMIVGTYDDPGADILWKNFTVYEP